MQSRVVGGAAPGPVSGRRPPLPSGSAVVLLQRGCPVAPTPLTRTVHASRAIKIARRVTAGRSSGQTRRRSAAGCARFARSYPTPAPQPNQRICHRARVSRVRATRRREVDALDTLRAKAASSARPRDGGLRQREAKKQRMRSSRRMRRAVTDALDRRVAAIEPQWVSSGRLAWPEWTVGQLSTWYAPLCPKCQKGERDEPMEAYAPPSRWTSELRPPHPCGCVLAYRHRAMVIDARKSEAAATRLHSIAETVCSPADSKLYRKHVLLGAPLPAGAPERVKLSLIQARIAYWAMGN